MHMATSDADTFAVRMYKVACTADYLRGSVMTFAMIISIVYLIGLSQTEMTTGVIMRGVISHIVFSIAGITAFLARGVRGRPSMGVKLTVFLALVELGLIVIIWYTFLEPWDGMCAGIQGEFFCDYVEVVRWMHFCVLLIQVPVLGLGVAGTFVLFLVGGDVLVKMDEAIARDRQYQNASMSNGHAMMGFGGSYGMGPGSIGAPRMHGSGPVVVSPYDCGGANGLRFTGF